MNDGERHKEGIEDGGQEGILRVPSLQVGLCLRMGVRLPVDDVASVEI